MKQRHIDNSQGIFLMWWNWTLSTGLLIASIIISLWLRPIYLPFAVWALDIILFLRIRHNRKAHMPGCFLLPFICSRALLWSAVVMVIINLMYSHWFLPHLSFIGPVNLQIPFITQLIVAPITLAISLWTNYKSGNLSFCEDCKIRYGTPAERGFLGRLFTQEGRFQNKLLIYIAAFSTVACYAYYFGSYVNESLTRADKFFFGGMTAIVYLISVVYCTFRYLGLWSYYCRKEENVTSQYAVTTQLRYLVFNGSEICLSGSTIENECFEGAEGKLDCPVQCKLPRRRDITLFDAMRQFQDITKLTDVDLRFMYANRQTNADGYIFHYLCFLTDEQRAKFRSEFPSAQWFTLNDLSGLINKQETAPLLAAEITRLHTMIMAWKTYKPDGTRIYRIKHYRPTFRLKDLANYNIDYADPRWLYVARNNEDTPFFRLRRFWRRYVNAIDDQQ